MDGAIITFDPLPYILTNSALTLLDQQPGEGHRAAAAHTALTRSTGQPGALDDRAADRWAGPTATLYSDLNSATPILDRPTLPLLSFRDRYRACFSAEHLVEFDSPILAAELQSPSPVSAHQRFT